jgi:hypothetical protein
MKRVEAEDAVDAGIREIDSTAVEEEEPRRRLISNRRQPRVQLPPEFQRARRDVKRDGGAAAGLLPEHGAHAKDAPPRLAAAQHVAGDSERAREASAQAGVSAPPFDSGMIRLVARARECCR